MKTKPVKPRTAWDNIPKDLGTVVEIAGMPSPIGQIRPNLIMDWAEGYTRPHGIGGGRMRRVER
jgi:hypothetical protein